MIALVESIAPRRERERERARVSIILDGIFKYLGKACSPRFLSAVTVTVRSIGRREGKKKKRRKKRKSPLERRNRNFSRADSYKFFVAKTVTNGCSSTADQDIDLIYIAWCALSM